MPVLIPDAFLNTWFMVYGKPYLDEKLHSTQTVCMCEVPVICEFNYYSQNARFSTVAGINVLFS